MNPFQNTLKADKPFTLFFFFFSFLQYFPPENICMKPYVSQQEMSQAINTSGHQEASKEPRFINSIYLKCGFPRLPYGFISWQ